MRGSNNNRGSTGVNNNMSNNKGSGNRGSTGASNNMSNNRGSTHQAINIKHVFFKIKLQNSGRTMSSGGGGRSMGGGGGGGRRR